VKVNKTIFVEIHTLKKWLHLVEECHRTTEKIE
jgi:hypothetical protein